MAGQITWDELKENLTVGEVVTGTVRQHWPFGVLVDLGHGFDGLIQVTDFKDEGVMTPDEYPAVGAEVRAVVRGFKDHGQQIWLSVRPSDLSTG